MMTAGRGNGPVLEGLDLCPREIRVNCAVRQGDFAECRADSRVFAALEQEEERMTVDRIWSYAPEFNHPEVHDLTGYSVEATDGTIGQVDRQADDSGMRHLIVDTGVWVFGRSVLVPVGVVAGIDTETRKITVTCTREEIKSAPGFRTDRETLDPAYLATVGSYYGGLPPRRPA
jgi:hypothetical protein